LAGSAGVVLALLGAAACGGNASSEVRAEDKEVWTIPASFIDCDAEGVAAGCVGEGVDGEYTALDPSEVTKPWNLCVTVPHVKDPIWVASNYGFVSEGRRLGVEIQLSDAGGYTGVTEQVKQIEDCATQGADAIIVGAVSQDALNPAIAQAEKNGVPVVDYGNGVTAPEVSGHAIVDYYEMGYAVGTHMVEQGEPMKVAMLPGPAGAGWVERSVLGFKAAIKGSQVELLDTKYGETAKEVQLALVEDSLSTYDELDAIVGTAVTLDVAHGVLAERGKTEDVQLLGTYLVPTTLELLESGRASCAATEQPVSSSKMAIDMAVRLLEDKPAKKGFERMGPKPLMVCGEAGGDANNLDIFDSTTSFAPDGWSPVSDVSAKDGE
jgi:protein TorT